jgi:hypothetical protein
MPSLRRPFRLIPGLEKTVLGNWFANPSLPAQIRNYLLRKGSGHRTLRSTHLRVLPLAFLHNSGLQPFLDQTEHAAVGNAMLNEL